jgi:uncharacterized protein (DUF2141 family)
MKMAIKNSTKIFLAPPPNPMGFSNDARRLMSAPSFDEARFEIRNNEESEIHIQIK